MNATNSKIDFSFNPIVPLLTALVFQVVWMRNGREVKIGKKYEYVSIDRKRILVVHNVTEEDVGIYECVLSEDRISLQLALRGVAHQNHCSYVIAESKECCF